MARLAPSACCQDLSVPFGNSQTNDLWWQVDALIDSAPSEDDLRSHRLEALAARRLRTAGQAVPADFNVQERLAAIAAISAPRVLECVADAYSRPAIVLKGPEVAALYPSAAGRNYGDIDLLVDDAEEAHLALRNAGFEPVGDPALYLDIHHLRPLRPPDLPLPVEIHSRPKWLESRCPPSVGELFTVARPSITRIDGMLTLPPAHHTLVLAVHSWAHEPLRRLRDIVDIAAMAERADRSEIERLAGNWGIRDLWHTTATVMDTLFFGAPTPFVLRTWARNLRTARERTVLESHLQRWLSDFWAFPVPNAAWCLPGRVLTDLLPDGSEGWRTKLDRTALAVRHATHRRSDHELALSAQLDSSHTDDGP